jgi:hypothetical protein
MACLLVAPCARRHTEGNRCGRRSFWPEPEAGRGFAGDALCWECRQAVQACLGIPASRLNPQSPRRAQRRLCRGSPGPRVTEREQASAEGIEPFLDDGVAVLVHLDEAAVFEVFHHTADHFAGSANHLRHVLAGNTVTDDQASIGIFAG